MNYNLHKVIILGNFELNDREGLTTIAIETHGLCINSILYIGDQGMIGESKDEVREEVKEQLYSDMYDEDTLKIKVREAYDGNDVVRILTKYINAVWDENLQVYWFDPNDEVFDKQLKSLENVNGRIYLTTYDTIFSGSEQHFDRDAILKVMETQGLKMENLIADSQISFAYFLTALAEKVLSR